MNSDTCIVVDKARPDTRVLRPGLENLNPNTPRTNTNTGSKLERYIALVDNRTFMRECMHRSMQAALPLPVQMFSTLFEFESQCSDSVALVFLSLADAKKEECANALKILSAMDTSIPIVVLTNSTDMDFARTAISFGVKGYIPCTTNFEIAISAVRFILEGGTYIPVDYLLASGRSNPPARQTSPLSDVLTNSELSVVRAVQEGKSNKVIAYQLGMCESTVKVHLRNVMKKLKAKNRTSVAMAAREAMAACEMSP